MNTTVAIIGGGYYGCAVADIVSRARPDLDVYILEAGSTLFSRASSTNQGQLHAGYMYSQFPDLARECVQGTKDFAESYGDAINHRIQIYYGVHKDSEISAGQYEDFCRDVGLPLESVPKPDHDFFGPLLTSVYETTEKTFDNTKLQAMMQRRLLASNVKICTNFAVSTMRQTSQGFVLESKDGQCIDANLVFNATFADSNGLHERSGIPKLPLEHAVFLHFLVDLPKQYHTTGVVVVRGKYAALTPAAPDSSASHVLASGKFRVVRTSHVDAPSEQISATEISTRYKQAVDEAVAYLPVLRAATRIGHTVGTRTNYIDPTTSLASSRAVVLKNYASLRNYHCVFGGKVSCLPEIAEPVMQIIQEFQG